MIRRARAQARLRGSLLLALGGALTGCGWVVGAGDYAVGDATTDSPGEEASSMPGDDSPADVFPGASHGETADAAIGIPDAPSDNDGSADADSGDSAGLACGEVPPASQASFNQIVRSCVLAISCSPDVFAFNASECINREEFLSSGQLSCLSTIADCNGFFECWGERISTLADCPATLPAVRCDVANNLAIDCSGMVVVDCNRRGGTCATYVDSTGNTEAYCVVAPSCSETDGLNHCTVTNSFYTCNSGVGFGVNCTLFDGTCNTFTDAGASCYENGPACTQPGYACSNGVLTHCNPASYRQSTRVDCAAQGFSCSVSDDGGTGSCLAPGCLNLDACPIESCGPDGKTLTVCAGGAPYPVDCSSLGNGFTSCATLKSSSGVVYGYCQ
jgi:hypothetical protein